MNPTDDPTTRPWPYWLLRYVGSDEAQALDDLIWSVGGSPPYGGVSYDEAGAVYELIEDYRGPGAASKSSFDNVLAYLDPASEAATALEVFRCADEVQSASESFPIDVAVRGAELSRTLGHRGAEASFLSFQSLVHYREGDLAAARQCVLGALDCYLELVEDDPVYQTRVRQSATNAISFTYGAGDVDEARRLLGVLASVLDDGTADQLRRVLDSNR